MKYIVHEKLGWDEASFCSDYAEKVIDYCRENGIDLSDVLIASKSGIQSGRSISFHVLRVPQSGIRKKEVVPQRGKENQAFCCPKGCK